MDSGEGLKPAFELISYVIAVVENVFYQIPGSHVIARYVKSSHQNDPGRTLLELILAAFAIGTLLQSRTRADNKSLVKLSEKEIDELVDDWVPESLAAPLTAAEQADLASVPVIAGATGPRPKLAGSGKTVLNMASFNFTGLASNEAIKERAIETLRRYGLGSCGPPGFYGTLDVHMDLERDIAQFLGTEASIIYSQGFSTVSSVIPAFCKRGDIIVADRGVSFAIQKGIQISRSTVRWYDHNDLKSLEEVLESVEKERAKKRGPLTRRFIVTEGIFENDGAMTDLPKLIELKFKHKYRLILDESYSFGTVGRTGRGLTELFNVPATQIDMLLGSLANGLCSAGGFCAGSSVVVQHQRINGTSFVFSASMPALLAVSASEGINVLTDTPSILSTLQDNVRAVRHILDRVECITIPSHSISPIIHIQIKLVSSTFLSPSSATHSPSRKNNPTSPISKDATEYDAESEDRLLQEVVEEVLAQGVLITRPKRLRTQEVNPPKPSIRLSISSALTKKECEKAATVLKTTLVKVLGKRR